MASKKRLLSGVKPTGKAHFGNYFGAMRQFVALQDDFECFFMIPDYHAIITVQKASELRENIINIAIDYLALGLDPSRSVFFKQSDVAAHTELGWIFNCITTMPYLMRAHAFKDAQAKNREINVGVFDYPLLMAADILLYDTDIVPVGQDQKQHVEYARDTAEKFNHIFGETFKLPEVHILPEVAVVPGLDGKKMSKSYHNTIPLFADDETIRSLVMSVVTDSRGTNEAKDPDTSVLFSLHKLFSDDKLPELAQRYREGTIGYKESKEILIDDIQAFVRPLREKRKEYENDIPQVKEIIKEGGERARIIAEKKMQTIREKIGVTL